jgi:ketosteroid isomerase-like protein
VKWQIPNTPGIPWAGTFEGHEGLQKFFAILDQEVDIEVFEPRAFIGERDTVVVLGSERVRTKGSGQSYEVHWAHTYRLSNGKVIEMREYTDTAKVAAAFSISGKVTA